MGSFLGIDIGGTNIKAGLVTEDGSLVASGSRQWSGGDPDEAVAVATDLAGGLSAPGAGRPVACGVGCAGLVLRETGVVLRSPNLPTWNSVPLRRLIETSIGLPAIVENDVNAAAYAEYLLGAARGTTSAVVIALGTGVGGGIVIGGRLYRGGHGFAGEFGHATIDIDGGDCVCGGSGCLETLVNAGSIVGRAVSAIHAGEESTLRSLAAERSLTAKDVGDAANGGDRVALAAVEAAGRAFGAGLANVVQVLDPDVIVVGGGVAAVGEVLLGPARAEMAARTCGREGHEPRLVPAEMGELAGATGAALLARDEIARG